MSKYWVSVTNDVVIKDYLVDGVVDGDAFDAAIALFTDEYLAGGYVTHWEAAEGE